MLQTFVFLFIVGLIIFGLIVGIYQQVKEKMGYYTRYQLTVSEEPEDLSRNFPQSYGEKFFLELLRGSDEIKWYEHDEEMRFISKQYPDILFTLSGEGEISGDIWIKYYQNGKCQTENAKITFGKFDKNKLV